MIACIYAVLTIFVLAPIAYGGIQFRLTEIMIFLAFYEKKYIPGLVVGCLIANIPSSLGVWDMCFGTFATLLACLSMSYLKNLYLGAFAGALFNGVIVGLELNLILELPLVLSISEVFIGEFVVLLIGVYVFKWIEKNEALMKNIILE